MMKFKHLKDKLKFKVKEKLSGLTTGEITYRVLHRVEDLTVGYVNFIKSTIKANKQAIKDATARLCHISSQNNENIEEDLKSFNEKIGGGLLDLIKN